MHAVFLLTLLAQSATAATAPPLEGFGWFRELAGSCWQGDHPGGRTRDRQCYSSQFGRFMRGTIALTRPDAPDAPAHQGDSVFAWDAAQQRMTFYFWGSDGQHAASTGHFEGELLVFPQAPASGGQPPGRRTVWRKLDADHFQVSVQSREGANWSERFTVTYARSGSAN